MSAHVALSQEQHPVWVVVPASNEARVIGSVVSAIREAGFSHVLVVDDGSGDRTGERAAAAGAVVVTHRLNRGKGAATKTGIDAAVRLGAEVIVTMDGDGQHDAADIAPLVAGVVEGTYDLTLGTRRWQTGSMPRYKIWHNKVANVTTWLLFRLRVTDSQSGFRAYSRRFVEAMHVQADFYDFESEVLGEIHRLGLRYQEVPIEVRYTDYSMSKPHRQGLANGLKTVYKMVWKLIS